MWNLLLYRVAPVICILVNGACIGRLYGFTPAAVFWWVLFWICGSAIHMALHETGHLLGGLCSGYKLVFCQVGSAASCLVRGREAEPSRPAGSKRPVRHGAGVASADPVYPV